MVRGAVAHEVGTRSILPSKSNISYRDCFKRAQKILPPSKKIVRTLFFHFKYYPRLSFPFETSSMRIMLPPSRLSHLCLVEVISMNASFQVAL